MHLGPLLRQIIKGSGNRPTRFHDERGNLVTPGGYIYAPHSLITTFLRRTIGYRPAVPWLSYRAQRYISSLLRPDWSILEFGSGMSTSWFARRCHLVYSIEHDPRWHRIVQARLSKKGISNVIYLFRDPEAYPDLSEFSAGSFDFVLIDGIRRADCVRNVLSKVKEGGWIYLDNTDMSFQTKPGNDSQQAEQLLLSFIAPRKGSVRYFTDLVPGNFVAKQGMLVHLGKD